MWAHRVDAAVPRATRHRCGLSHGIQQQCRLRGAVAARLQATRRALQGGGGDGDAAARRAFADALADGLHDLSLDFDAAYLQHRSHASVPVLLGGEAGGDSAVADAALPGDAACGGAAAALEAFLHFSRIVQPGGVLEETGRDNTGRGGLGSSAPAAPEGGDLLSCAVLLARHAHGAADAGAVRDAVDALGAEAAAAAAAAAPGAYGPSGARALADAVSGVLYRTHGFAGAEGHIYHPDSHCINRALDTRSGEAYAVPCHARQAWASWLAATQHMLAHPHHLHTSWGRASSLVVV
jgi:Transglutaminase-like superfamily